MSCHVTGAFFEDSREKTLFALDDAFLRSCGERGRRGDFPPKKHPDKLSSRRCFALFTAARLDRSNREKPTRVFYWVSEIVVDKAGRKSKKLTGKGWKKWLHILRLQIEGAELDNVCVVNTLSEGTSCLWLHLCNISLQLTVPSLVCFFDMFEFPPLGLNNETSFYGAQ